MGRGIVSIENVIGIAGDSVHTKDKGRSPVG
jgi:hypothetical protein